MPGQGDIILIVGPEGGITPASIARSPRRRGGARLGPSVLRASSAGAVAGALVLSGCGRWPEPPALVADAADTLPDRGGGAVSRPGASRPPWCDPDCSCCDVRAGRTGGHRVERLNTCRLPR